MKRKAGNKASRARLTGILMTVVLHAAAFVLVSFSSIKYLYPPPEEQSMLIDFSEEVSVMESELYSSLARGEDVDREKPIDLVQRSESPFEGDAENLTPESRPDDFGDVELPAPEPEEPVLDPRASFPGMAAADTNISSPHNASEASDEFVAGQSSGNTLRGRTEGKPNAHVKGRVVKGNIALPEYSVQESGIVVVDIWVDNYGKVVKAVPGGDGTTVMDKSLLAAARNAALATRFNENPNAPATQQGTITYYFNLN